MKKIVNFRVAYKVHESLSLRIQCSGTMFTYRFVTNFGIRDQVIFFYHGWAFVRQSNL